MNSVVHSLTLTLFHSGMKLCSLREGSCEVRYYLGSNVRGDENMIQIFLDSTQDSLVTLGEGSNQCNPPTPIWPIFVGIILGTIVVGILVIVLWRCGTYLGVSIDEGVGAVSIDELIYSELPLTGSLKCILYLSILSIP